MGFWVRRYRKSARQSEATDDASRRSDFRGMIVYSNGLSSTFAVPVHMSKLLVDVTKLDGSKRLAQQLAQCCREVDRATAQVFVLTGTLGTGKTQWVRYFCQAMGVPGELVTSPTYVLLQRYVALRVIYHFDFYRLEKSSEVWDLGIDELFEQSAILLIEWGDKFLECLPDDYLTIHLELQGDGKRSALLEPHGHSQQLIDRFQVLDSEL